MYSQFAGASSQKSKWVEEYEQALKELKRYLSVTKAAVSVIVKFQHKESRSRPGTPIIRKGSQKEQEQTWYSNHQKGITRGAGADLNTASPPTEYIGVPAGQVSLPADDTTNKATFWEIEGDKVPRGPEHEIKETSDTLQLARRKKISAKQIDDHARSDHTQTMEHSISKDVSHLIRKSGPSVKSPAVKLQMLHSNSAMEAIEPEDLIISPTIFSYSEIAEMENIFRDIGKDSLNQEFYQDLATSFSSAICRLGKPSITWQQVESWFHDKLEESTDASISRKIAETSIVLKGGTAAELQELSFEARSFKDNAW
ncbi:hypothetical protein KSS87_012965 [Heliosperma pusillum]|nr:hypothetical protein KSS87_012965 [Heliosperma pusillum]